MVSSSSSGSTTNCRVFPYSRESPGICWMLNYHPACVTISPNSRKINDTFIPAELDMNAHKYPQTLIGVLGRIMGINTKIILASEVHLNFKTKHSWSQLKFGACMYIIIKNYIFLHCAWVWFLTWDLLRNSGLSDHPLFFSPLLPW